MQIFNAILTCLFVLGTIVLIVVLAVLVATLAIGLWEYAKHK